MIPQALTDEQWQTFEEQGYVELGRIVTDEELNGLRSRIDEIMLGTAAVPYDQMMLQLDSTTGEYEDMPDQTKGHKGATLSYRKMQGLEYDPLFLAYLQKPMFRDICARAYGAGNPVSIYRAMFMNKPANQGTKLPWHQDNFSEFDRRPVITVWMAMDDSTVENGCVEVLPGSHRYYPDEDETVFLTDEQVTEVLGQYTPVLLPCKAGEGWLLHNRLMHTSGVNPTGAPRRAFSVCYMDGRAASNRGGVYSMVMGEGALQPEDVGAAMVG